MTFQDDIHQRLQSIEQDAEDIANMAGEIRRIVDAHTCEPVQPPDPPIDPPPVDPPPVEPPGPTPTEPPELDAFALFAIQDVEEAKAAARSTIMTRIDMLYPEPRTVTQQSIRPTTGPETIVVRDKEINANGDQKIMGVSLDPHRPSNLVLRNLRMGDPADYHQRNVKWFCRSWGHNRVAVMGCVVEGGRNPHSNDRHRPLEHGWYFNPAASTTVANCFAQDLGGHGPYCCHREFETPGYPPNNGPYTASPLHRVVHSAFIDCDQDAARGAHAMTFYDPGSVEFPGIVVVENVASIHAWPQERGSGTNDWANPGESTAWRPIRSNSSMVVHCYQQQKAGQYPTERVVIRNSIFWHVQSNRPLANLRNAKVYLFEDSAFVSENDYGNAVIEVGCHKDDPNTMPPKKVIIRNCKSRGVALKIWTSPNTFEVHDVFNEDGEWTWGA